MVRYKNDGTIQMDDHLDKFKEFEMPTRSYLGLLQRGIEDLGDHEPDLHPERRSMGGPAIAPRCRREAWHGTLL